MDRKLEKDLLNALEGMKRDSERWQAKREKEIWQQIEVPCSLEEVLSRFTKGDLDTIRKNANFGGISSLKKAELKAKLVELLPGHFKQVLYTLDQERFDFIKKAVKNGGKIKVDDDFPLFRALRMRAYTLLFSGAHNNQKVLVLPKELMDVFSRLDGQQLQSIIRRNTEWILLTHGMLHYYGVMRTPDIIDRLTKYTKQEVDTWEYFQVMRTAADYYDQVCFTGHGIANAGVEEPAQIIKEHQMRLNVDFYPFTKKELLRAGKINYLDRTPELNSFLRFLRENYDMTNDDAEDIVYELTDMIQEEVQPTKLIEFLQEMLEFPSMEILQQVTDKVFTIHNNTRLWVLKGHTPSELSKSEKPHLKPLPKVPFNTQANSTVVQMDEFKKTGRNEPCPCGSGKKFKKCCGR
ncbi:hypothetical protein GCM10008967_29620 [Bacillus carboniphilus]|uniref:SEC-C motif-containing protein n=1 Tax=Bacillus carboniphilus TaxID=86663 RepID=A0ABP3G769_9BACI